MKRYRSIRPATVSFENTSGSALRKTARNTSVAGRLLPFIVVRTLLHDSERSGSSSYGFRSMHPVNSGFERSVFVTGS